MEAIAEVSGGNHEDGGEGVLGGGGVLVRGEEGRHEKREGGG